LDEIGEMAPQLQAKLLRVLETRTFRRVGGSTDITVDVRVVAATHRDLQKMVVEGRFREDLYFRLAVLRIDVPALRERREDIPLLVEHFIRSSGIVSKRNARVSTEAMRILETYGWPGNARELQNVIERALILCDGETVLPQCLPIGMRVPHPAVAGRMSGTRPTLADAEKSYIRQVLEECGGHRHRAARILGISERNLYRKLKELQAEAPA
jgi:two-component system NtrC family response regulator